MELLCTERETDYVLSSEDPTILEDDRVLERLLTCEDRYVVTCNYFRFVQTEISPKMRKICVNWMMEVCEEEKCSDSTFATSVNCLDRFLSLVNVRKEHLQLLGCVCLFIASKMRQAWTINPHRLASYTEYSYEYTDIMLWEHLVLFKLKWDVASIVPHDYVDILLSRLPLGDCRPIVRKHTLVFVQLCTFEFKFAMWTASLIALGCVGAAINGLPQVRSHWNAPEDMVRQLQEITDVETNIIDLCIQQVEEEVAAHVVQAVQNTVSDQASVNSAVPCPVSKAEQYSDDCTEQQPETPTDVQDVIA